MVVHQLKKRVLLCKSKKLLQKDGSNKKGNNFRKSKSKLGTNLVELDGNIMRCHKCDSIKHFESIFCILQQ